MSEPIPSFPVLDQADQRFTDAKLKGDVALKHCASQGSNLKDIGLDEFRAPVARAAISSAVDQFVGLIPCARFPRQMSFGHAPEVAVPTRMSGIMVGGWRQPVRFPASKAMDVLRTAINANFAVACGCSGVWPNKAVEPLVRHNDGPKEFHRLASHGRAAKRVAMRAPAIPMRATPAAPFGALATIGNRAYSGVSHFSLHTRLVWSGLTRCFQHQISPLFLAFYGLKRNEVGYA